MRSRRPGTSRSLRITSTILLGSIFAAGNCFAAASAMASAVKFELDFGHRHFDGVTLTTVLLVSSQLTLTTDTLGAWTPKEHADAGAGFTLRHRKIPGVTLDISLFEASHKVTTSEPQPDYFAQIAQQLGEGCTVTERADSADGPPAIRLLGGRTRQALFLRPGGDEAQAEFHMHVSTKTCAIAFVLHGPAEGVQSARKDLRFFVSRLDTTRR